MSAYSTDLRERVVAAYDKNGHKSKVCRTFSIARTTLDKWLRLRDETGDLAPRLPRSRGYGHKVDDINAFREWVEQHSPFERIEDLRPLFEADFGKTISYSNLHRWLQRIGWTHKKNVSLTNRQTH